MFERISTQTIRSEPAKRALPVVIDVAKKSGARSWSCTSGRRDFVKGAPVERELTDDAMELVEAAVRDIKDAGVSARGEVYRAPYGSAASAIINEAAASDADLIVMGSRGLGELAGPSGRKHGPQGAPLGASARCWSCGKRDRRPERNPGATNSGAGVSRFG